jgi:hypothetical protein
VVELGAVVTALLRDTLVLAAVGLIVGVPAAFRAIRLVRSQLFGLGAAILCRSVSR